MDIRTRLKRGYVIRQGAIGLVCVVLGLWGVYDYFWTIPQQEQSHHKYVVASAVTASLSAEPSDEDFQAKRDDAMQKIEQSGQALLQTRFQEHLEQAGVSDLSPEQLEGLTEEQRRVNLSQADADWLRLLTAWHAAVLGDRPLAATQKLTAAQTEAYEQADAVVDQFAEVTPPAAYDRIMKGLIFIPCLPFGVYMLVMLAVMSRKHYGMDAEGNLHPPGGQTWKRDEIETIDMKRWMSKSIARVRHADGRELKLDDYIHQDMHLIVGALAHRFFPDQWHEDGRKVKDETEFADEPADAGDADGSVETDGEADRHDRG